MSARLYEEYEQLFHRNPFGDRTVKAGKSLLSAISNQKQQTWQNLVESTDMRRSSQKAWNLIRKLGNDQTANKQHSNVTANQVAHQLVLNGKTTHPLKVTSKINRCVPSSEPKSTRPFTEELNTGIKSLKNGKAIRLDNISVEEIKHFGLKARKWLLQFFNNCFFQQKISRIWRRTKVTTLFLLHIPGFFLVSAGQLKTRKKPGKNCSEPKSYRPTSLLSYLYKLLGGFLNRIAPIIETHIIEEQAGSALVN